MIEDAAAIAAWAGLLVAVIGAFFSGMVQLRSLPKVKDDVTDVKGQVDGVKGQVTEVHELVNSRAKEQDEKIARLERLLLQNAEKAIALAELALAKSEAREASLATTQDVHVVNPANDPIPVLPVIDEPDQR